MTHIIPFVHFRQRHDVAETERVLQSMTLSKVSDFYNRGLWGNSLSVIESQLKVCLKH